MSTLAERIIDQLNSKTAEADEGEGPWRVRVSPEDYKDIKSRALPAETVGDDKTLHIAGIPVIEDENLDNDGFVVEVAP